MIGRLLFSANFILCLSLAGRAQVYPVRTLSGEQGLNNTRVQAIAQDADRFIWAATEAGVSRTDGRTFTNLTVTDGLAGDKVTSLAVDPQNRVWAGHREAGISLISRDTIIRISEWEGLANNEVHAMLCASV